ncbi:MAG: ribosome silencing factor [Kiritimatiellia bacterium]
MTLSEKTALIQTALDDHKAEDIAAYDVTGKSSITDSVVIATATSAPHLRALMVAVERTMAEQAGEHARVSGTPETAWIVLDYFDVMVHLFLSDARKYYNIEALWK